MKNNDYNKNEERIERKGRLDDHSFGLVNGYFLAQEIETNIIEGLEDGFEEGGADVVFDAGFGTVRYLFQVDGDVIFTDFMVTVYNENGRDYEMIKSYSNVIEDDFWAWFPGFMAGEFFRACLALEYQDSIID